MSKVAITGNASGSGTLTIAAPNTNTDYTLTLPTEAGTVLTSGGAIDVNASAPADSLTIDSSGNVGIGTTSPTSGSVLDVASSGNTYPRIRSTAGSAAAVFFQNSDTGTTTGDGMYVGITGAEEGVIWNTENTAIRVATNNTERMRITSLGKTIFNTTTQNNNEQVGMVYSSNAGVGFSIQDSNPQSGNTFIEFRNGATVAGTVTSNGTTTMTYGSASDYRLKSNPQPIQNALATVSALNPVSFTWNQTGEEGIGFIAHELQAVCPDAVAGEKDAVDENDNPKYQMIDAGSASLIATLTAAIQELKAELDTVKAELADLKGQA